MACRSGGKLRHARLLLIPLAAWLAGCTPTTAGLRYPLLSPIEDASRYGYEQHLVERDRYQILFTAPLVAVAPLPEARAEDQRRLARIAFDLACWRAAELAQLHRMAGVRILDAGTRIDMLSDTFVDPYWDLFYARAGMSRYHGDGEPGFAGPATGSPILRARAAVTAQLVPQLGPGDLDAAALLGALRARYPAADRPPPPF